MENYVTLFTIVFKQIIEKVNNEIAFKEKKRQGSQNILHQSVNMLMSISLCAKVVLFTLIYKFEIKSCFYFKQNELFVLFSFFISLLYVFQLKWPKF